MRPETAAYFADMHRATETIRNIVSTDDSILLSDQISLLALERAFEILGEAAHRIRKIEAVEYQTIPNGALIIGLRNIIVHGYDAIDSARLVKTGRTDIAHLNDWLLEKLKEAELLGF
jgi:uncharacterized protein with HEPN domain